MQICVQKPSGQKQGNQLLFTTGAEPESISAHFLGSSGPGSKAWKMRSLIHQLLLLTLLKGFRMGEINQNLPNVKQLCLSHNVNVDHFHVIYGLMLGERLSYSDNIAHCIDTDVVAPEKGNSRLQQPTCYLTLMQMIYKGYKIMLERTR